MAAPTRVQTTGRVTASGTATVSLTFASPPTLGNTVLAAAIRYQSGGGTLTCADNRGNTYAQAVVRGLGNITVVVFVMTTPLATGSPFTVTITASGTSYFEAVALEVTGGVLIVDQTVTASGSSTAVSPGTTAAITGPDVFVVAGHAVAANQTTITVAAVSPVWVEELENLNYSATIAGEIDSRSLTAVAGTTQSANWTLNPGGAYESALVVFRPSVVAAPARSETFVVLPL